MILSAWFPVFLGIGLTIVAAILILAIAYKIRGALVATVFMVGILGSLLVTPYLHIEDLVLWIVAVLLTLRSVGLPKGLAAAEMFCSWLPVLGVPLVLPGGLVVLFRRERARSNGPLEVPASD